MERIRLIPKELMDIIPRFNGDAKLLHLYLQKCEYIIGAYRGIDNVTQDLYVFHAVTSRLEGKAAHLISERSDVNTWDELRELLSQHFGDPRSEECIAIELEQLKLNSGESFISFCNRIQNVRSSLFAKLQLIEDEEMSRSKMCIYNNTALNVFLYNLPEDMLRVVRLKAPGSLEDALKIVTEEVNFLQQYNARNKTRQNYNFHQKPSNITPSQPIQSFKAMNPQGSLPQQNFKFGYPAYNRFNAPIQGQGFRTGFQNQQPQAFKPPQQGFKFGHPQNQGFRFGIPQQQMGYRPYPQPNLNTQANVFNGPGPSQNQFRFGINPQAQQQRRPMYPNNTDVSMRTAPPIRNNALPSPDSQDAKYLFYTNNEPYAPSQYCEDQEVESVNFENMYEYTQYVENSTPSDDMCPREEQLSIENEDRDQLNFYVPASETNHPK